MKILFAALMILMSSQISFAKTKTVLDVFRDNKVPVTKVEVVGVEQVYYAELPFDPRIGRNTVHLEAEIASANGCKSFTIVSTLDKLRIKVTASRYKGDCSLREDLLDL